ncbi:F-box domain-containing protein [Meloidogyne graminicola]|uniref:F-box domain-containing protein n=1 Tax=Meloidogyne graminicola TaxID=189291 RepID=A0A8S9ZT75_9BILA|nr:F-box domain-containing protein [Meloidogyne graminicola]
MKNNLEYLPPEIQLKILKNLNFDQLFLFKQTNHYFYNFINKYKECLARKKFKKLSIGFDSNYIKLKNIGKINNKLINFPLCNNIQEKWLYALDKQIPIYLNVKDTKNVDNFPLLLFSKEYSEDNDFYLKLPLIPKNIEEMKIIYYWFKQIFLCDFEYIDMEIYIFNPEIIKLIFNNEEIKKIKFNFKSACLYYHNYNIWKFIYEHLVINGFLDIIFHNKEIQKTTENDINILLELLLNEGNKIKIVIFTEPNNNYIKLYNLLINKIETSTNLSKIVSSIRFCCINWDCSKLIVKGIERNESRKKQKYYKITNIYNSKIMFLIEWHSFTNNLVDCIRINRFK